jgi:hypothetical protein
MKGYVSDETWASVVKILVSLDEHQRVFDSATDQLMISPESPLKEPFYSVTDDLIAACSDLAGDHFDSLSWWVYENDHGRNGLSAGADGDMRKIMSYEDLRWLLEVVE